MPKLSLCGGDLVVLIEGGGVLVGLTFLFDIVDSVKLNGGVTKMNSPIPDNTTVTDHLVRNPDKVSVSGTMNCLSCSSEIPVLQLAVPALKRATSSVVYNADYFKIVSNTFIATNMALLSYNIDHQRSTTQTLQISMDFEAVNLAGSISAPSYRAGGFIYQ